MNLSLTDEQVNFILEVLQTQPLPFVRVAPIIGAIGQQVVAHQQAVAATPDKAE